MITKDEFDILGDLEKEIPEFEPLFDKQKLLEILGDADYYACVAYEDNKPAGYMIAYDRYQDGSFYCFISAVLPAFRKSGVYSAMAEDRQAYAQEKGYKRLRIQTRNRFRSMLTYLIKNDWIFFDVTEIEGDPMNNKIAAYKDLI